MLRILLSELLPSLGWPLLLPSTEETLLKKNVDKVSPYSKGYVALFVGFLSDA